MIRWIVAFLVLHLASSASAAHFEFTDPLVGAVYSRSATGTVTESSSTFGPLMTKVVGANPPVVAGVEFSLDDDQVVMGGWSRIETAHADARYTVGWYPRVSITIRPDDGEALGTPVTVWLHIKSFTVGSVGTSTSHWVTNLTANATYVNTTYSDQGWVRTSESFQAEIGDVIWLRNIGQSNSQSNEADQTKISDSRLVLSFSSDEPPDPPIASFPVPVTGSWGMGALGVLLGGTALSAIALGRGRKRAEPPRVHR